MRPPPPLPAYVGNYVGARYEDHGCPPNSFNCWQLFAHIQRCERGVSIPDYDGPVWAGKAGLSDMHAAAEAFANRFREVSACDAQEGDAVLMRLQGAPIHIGLVIASGWMLHINKSIDACIETYRAPHWTHRITGFYRP